MNGIEALRNNKQFKRICMEQFLMVRDGKIVFADDGSLFDLNIQENYDSFMLCDDWVGFIREEVAVENTLHYNPVSIDKPGTYRWFQSKHQKINDIIYGIHKIMGTTTSKTTHSELVDFLEEKLNFK